MFTLKKRIIILIFFLTLPSYLFSGEFDGHLKFLEYDLCNLKSSNPSKTLERNIKKFTTRVNQSNKINLKELIYDIDAYLEKDRRITCYEKINLSNIYANSLFRLDEFKLSRKLFNQILLYGGLDKDFRKGLDKMAARSLENEKILPLEESNSVIAKVKYEDGMEELKENKLNFLKSKVIALTQENTELKRLKISNESLKKEILILQSNFSLDDNLSSRAFFLSSQEENLDDLKRSLKIKKDKIVSLEISNSDAFALLDDSYNKIEKFAIKNDLLIKELKIKDGLIDKFMNLPINSPSMQESNNYNYWWFLLPVFLFIIFFSSYFKEYNQMPWERSHQNPLNKDVESLRTALADQAVTDGSIGSSFDAFIYNYIWSLSHYYFEDNLKSEIAFDEILEYFTGKDSSEMRKLYIFEISELAQEGKDKGKIDAKNLRKRNPVINLKNYLEKV